MSGTPRTPEQRTGSDSVDGTTRVLGDLRPPNKAVAEGEPATPEAISFASMIRHPAVGTTIGHYLVLDVLGEGGMGCVYRAFDDKLDRQVAIKVLRRHIEQHEQARLIREARVMAQLSHPNVVQVYEVGEHEGQPFIVMERVEGQTLRRWQRQSPRPDWQACVRVYQQAGAGLAAAHEQGLVHRDFKPANALIDDKGRVRVLDFGLARALLGLATDSEHSDEVGMAGRDDDEAIGPSSIENLGGISERLTQTGMVVGTLAYMPPEQIRRESVDTRGDQFSFCVSLYEAVYAQRPFAGTTMKQLLVSIRDGDVRPVPPGILAPPRLRAVLLRGLAYDPGARWRSMEQLLEALRRLLSPGSRRWLTLGGGTVAGLGLLGAGLAYQAEMGQRCTGALPRMEDVWDEGRRQAVQAAILDVDLPYAAGTWDRIGPQLDAYASAWVHSHTAVCEATSIRGEQSDQALDLRMRCLEQRRTALRAAVDVLADPDPEVLTNATKLVDRLPPLTRCDDLESLEKQDQQVPLPQEPQVATAVQAEREHLTEIRALKAAGRYAEGLDAAEVVMQRAEALGYPPLLAEALYWRGSLRSAQGQYTEAESDLQRAYTTAIEVHHDSIALDAAQLSTYLLGKRLQRYEEGRQWGEVAALPLARRSGDPLELAISSNNLGIVAHEQGDYDEAKHHYQAALELIEQTLGVDHARVTGPLANLGSILHEQGAYDEALRLLQRALAIDEQALGSDHPDVADVLQSIGNLFNTRGDYEGAKAHYLRALAIREAALGTDHPDVAMTLENLSLVLDEQGEYDTAIAYTQRSLEIAQRVLGADHPHVAISLNSLGNRLQRRGQYGNAERHYRRALEIFEKALGADHPHVAVVLSNLGAVLKVQRDYDGAAGHYQRALEIEQHRLGHDHPKTAPTLSSLGNLRFAQGDCDGARAYYERAIAIQQEGLGEYHPNHASTLDNLGNTFLRLGDYDSARQHHLRALAIKQESRGEDHPNLAYSWLGLAEVALATGDLASARGQAERAVTVRETTDVAPDLLAEAYFVLARVLWRDQSQRVRARALAQRARKTLAATERTADISADLDELDAWLAQHRSPTPRMHRR